MLIQVHFISTVVYVGLLLKCESRVSILSMTNNDTVLLPTAFDRHSQCTDKDAFQTIAIDNVISILLKKENTF